MLRNFIWDGENIVRQTDSNNVTCRSYTLSPEIFGELISQDGPTFHHGVYPERSRRDALGSTMLLTDSSQNTVISYLYRAFGEQTILSGSNPNRFGWVGRLGYYRQPDTSDYWVRARIDRPTIARWVSRDLRLALNRYAYAGNSPVNVIDASGRSWTTVILSHISPAFGAACAAAAAAPWVTEAGGGRVSNRYRHCMASCQIAKECGTGWANTAGLAKELRDVVIGIWDKDSRRSAFQASDFADNAAGLTKRPRGCPDTCEDRCAAAGLTPWTPEGPPGPFAR